ncbi:MAG TPA: adenylate/guanylate cyclase domain-containing protein, partial [Polyangiales bacterium]
GAATEAAAQLPDLPARELGELHLLSGLSHQHDFDFGPCLQHYQAALRAFAEAGDLVGQARTLRHQTRVQYVSTAASYGQQFDLEPHASVLTQLGEREPLIRGALLDVMSQVHWTARRTDAAETFARQAFAIGEAVNDDDLRHHASFSLGLALFQAGRLREAFEAYEASFAFAERAGDPWASIAPLQRLSVGHISVGDLEAATRLANDARVLAVQVCHDGESSFAAANLATIALARGELDAVQEHAREAANLAQRAHYPWGAMIALFALTWSRALAGRHADARYAIELLGKPGEFFDAPGVSVQFSVALWKDALDIYANPELALEERRARLTQFAAVLRATPSDANTAALLCLIVECAVALDLPAVVSSAHERLQYFSQQGMLLSAGAVFLLPRVLAASARSIGDEEASERHLDVAIASAERIGAKAELGRSLLARAGACLQRVPPDRERGAEALSRAHTLFIELGLEHECARASRLASHWSISIGPSARPFSSALLDAHETQLLRRIALGRAHADIARELLIDPECLAERVDRLFAKIEVNGPSLATAYAFAHGLVGPDSVVPPGPTVLMVTDMVDFTGLVQRVGDLHARTIMHVHNRVIRQQLAAHHGKEVTHTGDGLMASFRSGREAMACASAIQRQFSMYSREHPDTPIRVRIGVNAGYVLPEEDRLFGAALIAAVRICARAKAGQILLSDSALAMAGPEIATRARSLGGFELKGFASEVQIYELLSDKSPQPT